ncbi:MAG TPA: hypothetical protein VGV92_03905 [Gammaproteobacteria bacterium]|nr:hypothetical protein [Gammaproteobacteria bacterium]
MKEEPKYTVVTVRGQSYAFAESDRLGGGFSGVAYTAYPYDPMTQTLDKKDEKKVVVKAMDMRDTTEARLQCEVEFLEKKRFGLKGSYVDKNAGLFYIVMEFAGTALNPNELAKIEKKIEDSDGSLSPKNIEPFVDRLNQAVPEEEYSDKRYDAYDLGQKNLSQVFNLDEEFYQENVVAKKAKELVSPIAEHHQGKAQDESESKEESKPARGRHPGM